MTIGMKHFNVDSTQIDMMDVTQIRVGESFETGTGFWYREVQVVDKQGRCITLQLTAEKRKT